MRAVVAQAVDMTNQLLALLYKLGTGQDPKQTAQVRGCGRGESGVQPPRRRHSWGALAQPLVLTCVSWPPQACAALYLVSKVGSWFSFITLSYMGAPPSLRGCTSMARSAECNAHLLPCRLGAQLTLICGGPRSLNETSHGPVLRDAQAVREEPDRGGQAAGAGVAADECPAREAS